MKLTREQCIGEPQSIHESDDVNQKILALVGLPNAKIAGVRTAENCKHPVKLSRL
jgi:hypothetical protein